MSNVPLPLRRELATAALGSVVFILLGVAFLRWGEPGVGIVAWISIAFGGVGLFGVLFRLRGSILGPRRADLEGRQRKKAARRPTRAQAPVHHKGPLPELSAHRQREVRRQVRVMAEHGLFAPEVPDPALLYAGVAERDEPVKPDIILDAIGEVDFYHPGTDATRWLGNLAMHDSKAEQDEEAQIADIVRLAGGALDVRDVAVRHSTIPQHPRATQVDVTMTVNGEAVALSYTGHGKYLSTRIHHALAVRLRDGGSGKRLAALWVADQGVWLSVLADGAAEALNADLKLGTRSDLAWSWIDESAPFAAGEDLIKAGLA